MTELDLPNKATETDAFQRASVFLLFSAKKQKNVIIYIDTDWHNSNLLSNFNSELECVSKFTRMHFRHLLMPFCVFKPRFTSSKPSVFMLELQENLLETAPVSF